MYIIQQNINIIKNNFRHAEVGENVLREVLIILWAQ